jgi:2-oxoglutarate ferredoxin oxidoreductase subunit beta
MPLNPCSFALGAGARFVARSIDTEAKHLTTVLKRAHAHEGASFVEIYQNCPVYNDGIFELIKEKKTAGETRLVLEHGQPMIFGTERDKGIKLNASTLALEVVTLGEDGVTEEDLVVHDETNRMLAQLLTQLRAPEFPEPVGVIYCNPETAYEDSVYEQIKTVREKKGLADFTNALKSGHTWTVS